MKQGLTLNFSQFTSQATSLADCGFLSAQFHHSCNPILPQHLASYLSFSTTKSEADFEFSVFFSKIFNLPQIYFTVCIDGQNTLKLEQVYHLWGQGQEELVQSRISVKEHPLTGVPVLYLHHCNMKSMDASLVNKESLFLPQWISLTLSDLEIYIDELEFKKLPQI